MDPMVGCWASNLSTDSSLLIGIIFSLSQISVFFQEQSISCILWCLNICRRAKLHHFMIRNQVFFSSSQVKTLIFLFCAVPLSHHVTQETWSTTHISMLNGEVLYETKNLEPMPQNIFLLEPIGRVPNEHGASSSLCSVLIIMRG